MSQEELQDIARATELCEARAWEEIYRAIPADLAKRYGAFVERVGSAWALVFTALDTPLLNHVHNLGMSEPATGDNLDRIARIYGRAGIGYRYWLSPLARPAQLPGWMQSRGIFPRDRAPKLYRGVEPPPDIPTDLRVERIGPEHAEAFGTILCAGFEMPPFLEPFCSATVGRAGFTHYLAFDGAQPVACGALFVEDGVGWLGMAATLPSHRRRGGQGAIMARRIRDAAELGCRLLTTDTGEDTPEHPNPSYHNMLRTGFKLLYMRSLVGPAATHEEQTQES